MCLASRGTIVNVPHTYHFAPLYIVETIINEMI